MCTQQQHNKLGDQSKTIEVTTTRRSVTDYLAGSLVVLVDAVMLPPPLLLQHHHQRISAIIILIAQLYKFTTTFLIWRMTP